MKVFIKNKIIINGIYPMKNLNFYGYIEKTGTIEELEIFKNNELSYFYFMNPLLKASYQEVGSGNVLYEYFENENYIEKEIPSINDIEKKKILKEQMEKVYDLEKKIKLISGFPIHFPAFEVYIYNENKELISRVAEFLNTQYTKQVIEYSDSDKRRLLDNLKFGITDDALNELENKNDRFKRALYFYNKSFESCDLEIRFILLISSLESLFNISGTEIKKEVSNYASKILYLAQDETEQKRNKLEYFYKIRCNYIHGNVYSISKTDEEDLRIYVREILLIYWVIYFSYREASPKKIKNIIMNNDLNTLKPDVNLFLIYFRTNKENYDILYNIIKEKIDNKVSQIK